MNIFKKLRLKQQAKPGVNYKYLRQVERYKERLRTVIPPGLLFPEDRPVHFKHSGNCGDIIYAMPVMRAIAGQENILLHLNIDQRADYGVHIKHPMGNVMLNKKTADMLRPLILSQQGFIECDLFNNQAIDADLDLIRQYPLLLDRGNIARWYFLVFPVNYDLNKAWLQVAPDASASNAVVIARSMRYQSPLIDYSFLKKYPDIQFIGLPDEYEDMKKVLPGIIYRPVNDFLEMAMIIAGARLFIGNQSFPFSLAEGLKVNRILEVHFECPNVTVYGDKGFDFCFQPQFEKLVELRYGHF